MPTKEKSKIGKVDDTVLKIPIKAVWLLYTKNELLQHNSDVIIRLDALQSHDIPCRKKRFQISKYL